jgi:hypothetical protein
VKPIHRGYDLRLRFILSSIVVAGALGASGALAEEAAPPAKEGTATSAPAAHGSGSLPAGDSAKGAGGASLGGAAAKAAPVNAPAQGKAGGNFGGEKAGGVSTTKESGTPAKEIGTGVNPIDTRITVQPRATKKPPLPSEKKMSTPAAPPLNSARQTIPHELSGPGRNAIGARPDDHARTPGGASGLQSGPAGAAAKPAAGISTAPANTAISAHPGTGVMGGGLPAQNRAILTGTGIARPGSGPATIGGPARNATAINGTTIRAKQ